MLGHLQLYIFAGIKVHQNYKDNINPPVFGKIVKIWRRENIPFYGNRLIQGIKGWMGDEKLSALCHYLSHTMRNTTL